MRVRVESDGGRATIVLGDWPADRGHPSGPLPDGAAWAVDLVDVPARLRGAVAAMLSGVVVVADLASGLDLVAGRPDLRAVTTDGDLVGSGWVSGGSDRKPSTLEISSEIDRARAELAAAKATASENEELAEIDRKVAAQTILLLQSLNSGRR